MDVKRSHPGGYIDLHRLMETVLQLRLRVASLEKVLAGPYCGLNIRLRPRLTQMDAERMDAEREQQALQEKLIRCRMLLSEFPRA
jgi:hypothetical protein